MKLNKKVKEHKPYIRLEYLILRGMFEIPKKNSEYRDEFKGKDGSMS